MHDTFSQTITALNKTLTDNFNQVFKELRDKGVKRSPTEPATDLADQVFQDASMTAQGAAVT